ncbi:MAG: GTP-binding protein, partial [Candidatus Melainabacteria bacterium]|nr:GTP-binding protein [Candidatus Melainabacteria bacterium]
MKKTIISIIGRPNVGKSTLVNRLAGQRVAIVGEEAGITRDRNYIDFEWDAKEFTIIDTGGISFDGEDEFSGQIFEQAMNGLDAADALIFIVDVATGITKEDASIAELLRKKTTKPVYLAVNKVDSPEREQLIYEF